jgi:hypothetical protein
MYPTTFSCLHMLRTLNAMSTNSMKNNIALIILQCCLINYSLQLCNHIVNHSIHDLIKIRGHQYLVPTFIQQDPLCVVRKKNLTKKTMKKKGKKKKKPKVNLIFSHVNHIFLISDPWIIPKAWDTIIVPKENMFFKMWKRVQFKVTILLQIGPWAFGPWTLV